MTRHPCAHPEEPPTRRWGPVRLAQSMTLRMARSPSWPSRRAARQPRGAWRTPEFRWCRISARAAASRTKGCRDSPAKSPDLVGGAGRYVSIKYAQFRWGHVPTVVAVQRPLGAKARRIPDALHLAQPQSANDRAPGTQGHNSNGNTGYEQATIQSTSGTPPCSPKSTQACRPPLDGAAGARGPPGNRRLPSPPACPPLGAASRGHPG